MVQEWYGGGTGVVREWYGSGTGVVREWYGSGTGVYSPRLPDIPRHFSSVPYGVCAQVIFVNSLIALCFGVILEVRVWSQLS